MIRLAVLLIAACLGAASANAECSIGDAMQIHNSPVPEKEDQRFDSKVTKRSEGAAWSIFNDKTGKPLRLIHTDYGESGRDEHILTVGDATSYIITTHSYFYLAPLSYEGSNVYREEVNHYLFCDAKLDLPPEWDEYDKTYLSEARRASDFFFNTEEIASQITAAKLKQPTWK